jgi:Fe-S cluster assembly protein SufD
MTTADTALLDRLVPGGPPDPSSLRATNWLLSHGLPDPHDEHWRYSPVAEIISRLSATEPAQPRPITRTDIDRLAGVHGPHRLVIVNGVYVPSLSDIAQAPPGVWIGRLSELPTDTVAPPVVGDDFTDGFHALNRAASTDPVVVVSSAAGPPDARGAAPTPVHIVHVAAPGAGSEISQPRIVIDVGDHARLHLIETFTGIDGASFTNASTTVGLGCEASVIHLRVQSEDLQATHLGHTFVSQQAGSFYDATSLMLGADIARHTLDVRLLGPSARSTLTGLYRPGGHQRHDTSVSVDHSASHGTSTQEFKGIIDDHARGSFSGRIIVRPGTVDNDAQQTNRNLVLQPTAQADSRPWLEIFADDVRCAHGATVGRLDEDALFYLRSRGIPHDQSRTMLIEAFAREITDAIDPASLRDHITTLIGDPREQRS